MFGCFQVCVSAAGSLPDPGDRDDVSLWPHLSGALQRNEV